MENIQPQQAKTIRMGRKAYKIVRVEKVEEQRSGFLLLFYDCIGLVDLSQS